jgi:hypothetical protein
VLRRPIETTAQIGQVKCNFKSPAIRLPTSGPIAGSKTTNSPSTSSIDGKICPMVVERHAGRTCCLAPAIFKTEPAPLMDRPLHFSLGFRGLRR